MLRNTNMSKIEIQSMSRKSVIDFNRKGSSLVKSPNVNRDSKIMTALHYDDGNVGRMDLTGSLPSFKTKDIVNE